MTENKELEQEIHNESMKLRTSPCYEELEAFARHFVEWGRNHHGHVSEDLDKEMDIYIASVFSEDMDGGEPRFTRWFCALRKTAIHFANWQKEQFEKERRIK